MALQNPWIDLPTIQPYVLDSDAHAIEAFNSVARADQRYHLEILPEPFLGLPTSEVVLLSLNPGFSPEEERFHHLDDYFRRVALANLAHAEQAYPFYFLEPGKGSPGHAWWQKRLRSLIDLYGHRIVARKVLCLEYFPYHSEHFHRGTPHVPSQSYTFALLKNALARSAVVIGMRSLDLWYEAVPELNDHIVHTLNSTQAVYVSANNCPTGFGEACKRLASA
jgi:hypothetical protein